MKTDQLQPASPSLKKFIATPRHFVFLFGLLALCAFGRVQAGEIGPDWAIDAVWYQIFPERFANGDQSNDPTLQDIAGSWPHDTTSNWNLHPWTSDWYELQPWEEANSQGFYFNVQRRRYGGDLQGVINRLPYLADLGITAIYFNPLFEAPSLHKYDATLYHHIDDNFGPSPQRDRQIKALENPADPTTWRWTTADSLFIEFLHRAHTLDIRVIIDGVFNHVGMTSFAFQDVKKNQQEAQFADWFIIKSWDDPATPENEFDYQGWAGVRELPEIREEDGRLAEGADRYFDAVIRRWMDPNNDGDPSDGIDGWRLDVAEKVGKPHWKHFRRLVKSINPDAYITAELFWEDWPAKKLMETGPWLQGDMFDAVMNYHFAEYAVEFFINEKKRITPSAFDKKLRVYRAEHPEEVNYLMMNLMGSHDTDHLGSMIVNPDRYIDHECAVQHHPRYKVRKPNASEYGTQKLIAAFQMTYLGAPMIYYGDEVGMWGADDPDCRKPMVWADKEYAVEDSHPLKDDDARPPDSVKVNSDLLATYKELIDIRKNQAALRRGDFETVLTDDQRCLYSFDRSYQGETVRVLFNNSGEAQQITKNWQWKSWEVLYGTPADMDGLTIPAKSVVIWHVV